ncbi:hypothetical protein DOM22_07640 [Bdellovibrio sp. ZAP7]|uniref:hypothetical protein n=1 Tax=Bdellovibrio sp. ZAP7 TaxID=2231053 RepID=UPI00115BDE46|nr:hypothetical protein [Bdellovibrio sp. ZAP7]QDK45040.1 hypothetical protein DOM22_07640 [Bdellovibrio sp. ZAP7]
MGLSRRDFLNLNNFTAFSAEMGSLCVAHVGEFSVETQDSPFFEHFHSLTIPIKALIQPPADGIVLKTTPVDQDSYDVEGFKTFIGQSHLDPKALSTHSHDVKISQAKLLAIAGGEKNVEVRVISAAGNYVHNFLISASPMTLATIRKQATKE